MDTLVKNRRGGAATDLARPTYKVADLSLAEWGRKEIRLAEHEMPGLMAARKEYGPGQPLAGHGRRLCHGLHRPATRRGDIQAVNIGIETVFCGGLRHECLSRRACLGLIHL